MQAVLPLENIPDKDKDWHPGSNEQVLDLVHPSLFPLVYGQSRIIPDSTVGIQDSIRRCGDGEVIPVPSNEELKDPQRMETRYSFPTEDDEPKAWSRKFQWLPSEFKISSDSEDVMYVIRPRAPAIR